MPAKSYEVHGVRVLECDAEGSKLGSARDAVDIIAEASPHRASLVVIPTARLGDDFFRLSTRIAGEVIQRFLIYGIRVAIIGDISQYVAESNALRDFIFESNRGEHGWFVKSREELGQRLRIRNS